MDRRVHPYTVGTGARPVFAGQAQISDKEINGQTSQTRTSGSTITKPRAMRARAGGRGAPQPVQACQLVVVTKAKYSVGLDWTDPRIS